jgi:hypothetical protein
MPPNSLINKEHKGETIICQAFFVFFGKIFFDGRKTFVIMMGYGL